MKFKGNVYLVAVGKAAWQMAKAAVENLTYPLKQGIVVTKYNHVKGDIKGVCCYEGGHPIPDEGSFKGTQAILDMTKNLEPDDTVLFLLSGGGSSLFENPKIQAEELQDITRQLLACGADIKEINTIRKRLSMVKGGRFAQWCSPANVKAVVLSDVLGDQLDMIASGPVTKDLSTSEQSINILKKYHLKMSEQAIACIREETPKKLVNVQIEIIGSVRELCNQAMIKCKELGYETHFLTHHLDCEAKEAGIFLADILLSHERAGKSLAFIAGGETVVHLTGNGLGGRNQELALSAARKIAGLRNVAIFSVGSDGTDGPTNAAGGYVDGDTLETLKEQGILIDDVLNENDSYSALKKSDGLIITGATGTNVNDLAVALLYKE